METAAKKAKDLLTGEEFEKKRANQKFATRQNQIVYNNLMAGKKRKEKSGVDKILDKNRSILKNILGTAKEVIKSKDFLLGAGFHFGVLSHFKTRQEQVYYCIYDYAYTKAENSNYKIIKYE